MSFLYRGDCTHQPRQSKEQSEIKSVVQGKYTGSLYSPKSGLCFFKTCNLERQHGFLPQYLYFSPLVKGSQAARSEVATAQGDKWKLQMAASITEAGEW